jgi:hypothetical protein
VVLELPYYLELLEVLLDLVVLEHPCYLEHLEVLEEEDSLTIPKNLLNFQSCFVRLFVLLNLQQL